MSIVEVEYTRVSNERFRELIANHQLAPKWSSYDCYRDALSGEWLVLIPFSGCTGAGRSDDFLDAFEEAERTADWILNGRGW